MQIERQIGSGAPDQAIDEDAPPSIVINPFSELGKELLKWEQHRTELVPRGKNPGNPYVFRPYPKMLYRAQRRPNGQYACMMAAPSPYDFEKADQFERAILMKETFDKSCQRIVADESQDLIAKGQGWCDTPDLALAQSEAEQRAIGEAAAEAAFTAQRMSAQAKAELKAADDSTHAHVVDVKAKRKGGRPRKGVVAVTEG